MAQRTRPRYRTKYDQAQAECDALMERLRLAGGPYGAPHELVDRCLGAAQRLWMARGRVHTRR
jgi:hypothetical protein